MTWISARIHDRQSGMTLIELLVSMAIFSTIMAIITAGIVSMLGSEQRTSGQASNLEAGNRVIQDLDHQVRYADAITSPGTGTSGSYYYVEYETGNAGQAQVCTQWRYGTTAHTLAWRTWNVTSTGSLSGSATSWSTAATSVYPVGSNSVFSITPAASVDDKEQLTVMFGIENGTPTQTTQFQTALTASNTSSDSAPTSACAQVGRP